MNDRANFRARADAPDSDTVWALMSAVDAWLDDFARSQGVVKPTPSEFWASAENGLRLERADLSALRDEIDERDLSVGLVTGHRMIDGKEPGSGLIMFHGSFGPYPRIEVTGIADTRLFALHETESLKQRTQLWSARGRFPDVRWEFEEVTVTTTEPDRRARQASPRIDSTTSRPVERSHDEPQRRRWPLAVGWSAAGTVAVAIIAEVAGGAISSLLGL